MCVNKSTVQKLQIFSFITLTPFGIFEKSCNPNSFCDRLNVPKIEMKVCKQFTGRTINLQLSDPVV